MLSASRMACLIDATVESMLTITPFFNPREGCVPIPMTSRPSGPSSPTTAAILVVPMSRPTMMSDDFRGMEFLALALLALALCGLLAGRLLGLSWKRSKARQAEIPVISDVVDFFAGGPGWRGRGRRPLPDRRGPGLGPGGRDRGRRRGRGRGLDR